MWIRRVIWGILAAVIATAGAIFHPQLRAFSFNYGPLRSASVADMTANGEGLKTGAPVFLRIFKDENELELWADNGSGYELIKTYPICYWSGELGPKLEEGDGQSPEGFYKVRLGALNPNSTYHLSFNLGFPNAFDRAHGRTGSYLMVHGSCVSIGCYAMTNPGIEEIYGAVEAALRHGQRAVAVHIFPFRMTAQNMERHAGSEWIEFWRNLKQGYDAFEADRKPPKISVDGKVYRIAAY